MSQSVETPDPYAGQWKNVRNVVLAALLSLGLLASIFFRMVWKAKPGGDLTNCKSRLSDISTALNHYSTDHGGTYPSSLEALVPTYLKAMPECPASGSPSYRLHVGPTAPLNTGHSESYYYIECAGENHKRSDIEGDFPAYNSVQGLVMPGY